MLIGNSTYQFYIRLNWREKNVGQMLSTLMKQFKIYELVQHICRILRLGITWKKGMSACGFRREQQTIRKGYEGNDFMCVWVKVNELKRFRFFGRIAETINSSRRRKKAVWRIRDLKVMHKWQMNEMDDNNHKSWWNVAEPMGTWRNCIWFHLTVRGKKELRLYRLRKKTRANKVENKV